MRKRVLSAEVTRDIILDEVKARGPIGFHEMEKLLQEVFPGQINIAILASSLAKRRSGLALIEGVIDTCPAGLAPPTRREAAKMAKERKTERRRQNK